jgi:DnaJ-class molecular chaperone
MIANRDKHLKTLGLDTGATDADIKAAYRKLAMEHHPDRPNGDADVFAAIGTAYRKLTEKPCGKCKDTGYYFQYEGAFKRKYTCTECRRT